MAEPPPWLEGARRAPSRYNTQPWRFRRLPEGRIEVLWEAGRELPASDPDRRDLFLALGAAVESACIASATAKEPLRFVADVDIEMRRAGYLEGAAAPQSSDVRLGEALRLRHTGRVPHLDVHMPSALLSALRRETVGWAACLYFSQDRVTIGRCASLARTATRHLASDARLQRERSAWLRLGAESEPRDGVAPRLLQPYSRLKLATHLGQPPWSTTPVLRSIVGLARGAWMRKLVRRSNAVCLLTAPSLDPVDLLHAGRLFLRLSLIAADAGFTTHPIDAPIAVPETAARLSTCFKVPGGVPVLFFRLGMCPHLPPTGRLPWEELLVE